MKNDLTIFACIQPDTKRRIDTAIVYPDMTGNRISITAATTAVNQVTDTGQDVLHYISPEKFPELIRTFLHPHDNIILLTDSPKICRQAKENGICCIGLETEGNPLTDAWSALLPPYEIDATWLRMQLCHFRGIPCCIWEEETLRIRESIDHDFPEIRRILQAASLDVKGFREEEAAMKNTFRTYTASLYHLWGFGMWTVETPGDNGEWRIAGWCGLFPSDSREGGVELGYVIAPEQQGRGIGYRSCRRILEFAEDHLGIDHFVLRTKSGNLAARALAEKLGFLENDTDSAPDSEFLLFRNYSVPPLFLTSKNLILNAEAIKKSDFSRCGGGSYRHRPANTHILLDESKLSPLK